MTTPAERPLADAIGKFRNEWRQRVVYIFANPDDPAMVVTIGYPFDGSPPIICDEPREAVAQFIGSFDKVYR